jgi:GH24 family phage-related lysozyme (muramidase)
VWTNAQIDAALAEDVTKAASGLDRALPWLKTLGEVRWAAMVNQCFNMGLGNLLQFHEQLSALQSGNWVGAVKAMQSSEWYKQVPNRVDAIGLQLITNEWVLDYLDADQRAELENILNG